MPRCKTILFLIAQPRDIAIHDGGACIVYAYNRDDDANNDRVTDETPSAVDSNERLGFRLSNGELRMRLSGATNENCTDGSWESITEPEVQITGLTFTLTSTPSQCHQHGQ